ncbi:SWI5-dependent HO expression protein 3 [Nakaseomyces glabratus]|nr:SWI5-dependent HO expression protein 3 [Nakaseomyces glabratus]KTB16248.1 SWI5-dependent HO expression protein 3 [Nakaseomyces glabratus]
MAENTSPTKLGQQYNLHVMNMQSPNRFDFENEDTRNSTSGSVYGTDNERDIWSANARGTPLSYSSSGNNDGDSAKADASTLPSASFGGGGSNISSKVIESLNVQVDTLSNTNLQLTSQYQEVLKKLQDAVDREAEWSETVSKLQVHNREIKTALEDKTAELKECDNNLLAIKKEYEQITTENSKLASDYKELSKSLSSLRGQYAKSKIRKNILQSLQEEYKQACNDEIEAVRNNLDMVESKIGHYNSDEKQKLDDILDAHSVLEKEVTSRKLENETAIEELETKWNDLSTKVHLESITEHYSSFKSELAELCEKMDIPVKQFPQTTRNRTPNMVMERSRFRKPTPDASKRASFYGITSPMLQQGFKIPDVASSSAGKPKNSVLPGVKSKR